MKTNNRMRRITYTKEELDAKLSNIVTTPVFLPSQIGRLAYTGDKLTPTWDNYNSNKLTIGGTTSATDAGTYEATFTPKSGYTWADGTTDTKVVKWQIVQPILGAIWDGTSTTAWTRTDDAEFFTDPVPYVSGATEYSSPFDNIQPWAGIKRVTDNVAGELVEIPKFWYKWTQSGDTLKLQISASAQDGFYVSPAHADKGDGAGERDVVYVGRYHCASDYKSTTGVSPKVNITRYTAHKNIAALGDGIYQWDMAMHVTIQMLYLVEFADWDSQAKIGYGCGNGSDAEAMGVSDTMPYHTGTMQSSRTTYGVGVQYRYIEGLWDNCWDWLGGCYYDDNGLNIIKNPANYSNFSGGTYIGCPSTGYPSKMSVSTVPGFEWVIYPTETKGSNTTYVPDWWDFDHYNAPCLYVGGEFLQRLLWYGLFCVWCQDTYESNEALGARLMKLP